MYKMEKDFFKAIEPEFQAVRRYPWKEHGTWYNEFEDKVLEPTFKYYVDSCDFKGEQRENIQLVLRRCYTDIPNMFAYYGWTYNKVANASKHPEYLDAIKTRVCNNLRAQLTRYIHDEVWVLSIEALNLLVNDLINEFKYYWVYRVDEN